MTFSQKCDIVYIVKWRLSTLRPIWANSVFTTAVDLKIKFFKESLKNLLTNTYLYVIIRVFQERNRKRGKIMLVFLFGVVVGLYELFNILMLYHYNGGEMVEFLWKDQNIIGKIAGNLFYLPAWVLKHLWYSLIIVCRYLRKWLKPIGKSIIKAIFDVIQFTSFFAGGSNNYPLSPRGKERK